MNFSATIALSLAMSTDAFAAAVGIGVAMQRPHFKEALRCGLIFGVIEAITPVIGWMLGRFASEYVAAWDHWIALVLLAGLGLHMVFESFSNEAEEKKPLRTHRFRSLALTGLATSIDAMAVGASFAFLNENILTIATAIGLSTFVMVTLGVMVGRVLGLAAGKHAERLGGLTLIAIGCWIFYEHTAPAPWHGGIF